VVLAARRTSVIEDEAARLRACGGRATAVSCDVADRASVSALMETIANRVGRLDVLVNNAGLLPAAQRAEDTDIAVWDGTLELNLTAPWLLATKARQLMQETGGVIVNVSSTAAFYPSRGLVAYNVSKAGLVMLTRVLALEWARYGIRVVAVAPGKVDTELLGPIKAFAEKRGQHFNPQQRLGQPVEVAALVSYLASGAAAFVTGVVVPIDGGELLTASSDTAK
jgi:NAD(P)-dependent dehydrogenase (short-subunit alcohol dehydrogenase family)